MKAVKKKLVTSVLHFHRCKQIFTQCRTQRINFLKQTDTLQSKLQNHIGFYAMKIQERLKEYLPKSLGERRFSIVRTIVEICLTFYHNEPSITLSICKLVTALTGTLSLWIMPSTMLWSRKKKKKYWQPWDMQYQWSLWIPVVLGFYQFY